MKLTTTYALLTALLLLTVAVHAQDSDRDRQISAVIQDAKTLADAGKHDEAIARLDEALAQGIEHAAIYTLKGRSYLKLGKPTEAFAAFTAALKIDPDNEAALAERARIWLQYKQFDNAIADATRLIDAGVPAYEIRGDAHRIQGNYAEALRDYSSLIEYLIKQGKSAKYGHDMRGLILANLRAYDLAVGEYDKSLAVELDASTLASRARSLARLKRYDEAAADFGKALSTNEDAYLLLERAELHAFWGKAEAALADVAKAQEIAPDDEQVQANARLAAERIPSIAAQSKKASAEKVKTSSGDENILPETAALAARADAAFAAEQYEEAMSNFNQLIELGHPDGYRKRGILLTLAQRHTDALGDFSKALARHGETQPDLIWMRAERLFRVGAYDLALAEYERAFKLNVNHPGSRENVGIIYSAWERYRDAVAAFTFEIEAGSENLSMWISRGRAYEQLNEFDKAIADYRIAADKAQEDARLETLGTLANDSLTRAQRRKQIQETLTLIERGDASGLVQLMDPMLQKFVSEELLGERLKVILQSYGKPTPASLMNLEISSLRVRGQIAFEQAEVNSEFVYDGGGRLVGFGLQVDGFGLDTFDTLHPPEQLAEVAKQFWQLVYTGKGKQAYKLMVPAASQKTFPLEQFLSIVNPIAEKVKETGLRSIPLHVVRIHKPTKPGDRASLDIYHLIELNDLRYNPARLVLEILDDDHEEGEFKPRSFDFHTGKFEDTYPIHDFSAEEECFRAIVSGDLQEVLNLIHPKLRPDVNPAVLKVVLATLQDKLGTFHSIAPARFYAQTEYAGAERTTFARGSAQFEKATVPVDCTHEFGWLKSFNVKADVSGWIKRIEDTAALEKQGETFLLELINGEPEKAYAMLPAEFRAKLTLKEMGKMRQACGERIGTAKMISFESKEYGEKTEVWKFYYRVVTDKLETKADVTFDFDAFGGSIGAFNISFKSIPEEEELP